MRRVLALASLTVLLPACSGGSGSGGTGGGAAVLPGSNASTDVAAPQTGLLTASSSYTLSSGSQQYPLPTVGGASGSISINATTFAPGTKVQFTGEVVPETVATSSIKLADTNATPPAALSRSVFALQVVVSGATTFGGLPAFMLTDERFRGVPFADASFLLYGDAACTNALTSGTVTRIDGATASIDPGTTPVTLNAGQIYTFVFTISVPATQSALFLDSSNNAVIAVDVSHTTPSPASYLLTGAKTQLDEPQDVASGPSGEVVVLNREHYPLGGVNFGNYYQTTSSALVFQRDAEGNSEPSQVLDASGDVYTHVSTAPSGIVYAWSRGYGAGSLAGLKYLLGPAAQTFTNQQIPIQGSALTFDDVAVRNDGTIGYTGPAASPTGFYDALCIGATCSQAPKLNPVTNMPDATPYYDYTSMAFNPQSDELYGIVPASLGSPAHLDVYPASGFVLDQPASHIALPANVASAGALQFDVAGNAYIYGKATNGDRSVVVYAPSGLASGTPVRIVDLESALAGRTVTGFAVQVR